jgi:hypothetical protein
MLYTKAQHSKCITKTNHHNLLEHFEVIGQQFGLKILGSYMQNFSHCYLCLKLHFSLACRLNRQFEKYHRSQCGANRS